VLECFNHSYLSYNSTDIKTTWILIKKHSKEKEEIVGGITYNNKGYIDYLCVNKKFRNQGVGKWLINIVLDELEESVIKGFPHLIIDLPKKGEKITNCIKLIIFYRQFGFKVQKITKESIYLYLI
jgi:ribosomal protein S18 acetylase RimI-like enzyme